MGMFSAIDNMLESEEGSDADDPYENSKHSLSELNDFEDSALTGECKVWRNPMALFRGAEYSRFSKMTG